MTYPGNPNMHHHFPSSDTHQSYLNHSSGLNGPIQTVEPTPPLYKSRYYSINPSIH